ncbi:MAG: FAD-binding protein [Pseudomonadota bacterium]
MAPATEAELAEAVRSANAPLAVRGGGTRTQATDLEELSTKGLSGIALYEPGALTMVAGAGTPLAEIEESLDQAGQRLAFEPTDLRGLLGTSGSSTIGGVVATNASGPRRMVAGACRDHMLGVRFVDGHGTVIKNGGRVMKNVTGYDLVKLLTGSHGTLGVLTEVSFKTLPKPQLNATLIFEGLLDTEALKAMSAALTTPYEVSGAAHLPEKGETYLRLEGFEDQVAYRTKTLQQMLARVGDARVEMGTDALWGEIRDAVPIQNAEGDIWRISVQPSKAAEIVAKLRLEAYFFDWGGGLIWARSRPDYDLRADLSSGHATCLRGTAQNFHPEAAGLAKVSQGIREKFDPHGLFNPGLMA